MNNQTLFKALSITSIVLAALTVGWIVLMALSMKDSGPLIESYDDALDFIKNQNLLFTLNYINATLLTVLNTVFYTLLYIFLKSTHPILAKLGFIFIPVYTTFALIAYTSQISIVSQLQSVPEYRAQQDIIDLILSQLTQAWRKSGIAFLNNYAYAILGIPSILFGKALQKESIAGKIAGWCCILNGFFCIVGFIGLIADSSALSNGSTVGGVLFLFFLIISSVFFYKKYN